jgi:mono/diheme cytochrome c family protein
VNRKNFLSILFAVLLPPSMAFAWQTTPSAYFEQNCSACHTIGSGASVGPDLKNVTQRAPRHWLVEFIHDPEAKIAAKDPYAIKIVADSQGVVMTPSPDVTGEFGEALLEYIDQQSGVPVATLAPLVQGNAVHGRELFLGRRRFSNGGATCIACHQVSGLPYAGGRLGPDLSAAYQKLGGDRGLSSWLQKPPSRMMSTIFRTAPLSPEESADLAAFFGAASDASAQLSHAPVRRVQAIGLAGSLLVLLIAGVVWRNRLAVNDVRSSVRKMKRGGQ